MMNTLGLLLVALVFIGCQEVNKKDVVQAGEIDVDQGFTSSISYIIDSLYVVDQKVQQNIVEAFQSGGGDKMEGLYAAQHATFERHVPILKSIYSKIGYPTIALVGDEASSKFFTLVQHSDKDVKFQEKMLSKISAEVRKGNVSAKNYAFLTDRVQLSQQKPQVYGTQVEYNTDIGQVYPKATVDSLKLNKRRKEIGLEPIEEYLNKSIRAHFQMNKAHYDEIGVKEPYLYTVDETSPSDT
jgi:hypothetical protein